ncbi:MAG: hypothetical protein FJX23_07400 [Alphaproteobacteria bacterium]|nr:hypothetical protein [Alphaproteobacteria bacterium]
MFGKWTTKSSSGNGTPPVNFDDLGDELAVILVQGKNSFGDDIYCYLNLPLKNIKPVQDALAGNNGFTPSKFGTVLAAGRGQPTEEVKREIGQTEYTVAFEPRKLPAAFGGAA